MRNGMVVDTGSESTIFPRRRDGLFGYSGVEIAAMKTKSLLLAVLLGVALLSVAPAATIPESLREAKRIAFIGDSITQGGDYVVDFECFLLANGLTNEVVNLGLSSETASDLTAKENEPHKTRHGFGRPEASERLARTLSTVKPDWLIVCYGMNDGDNLPAGDEGTKRFGRACEYIRKTALNLGVKHVILCTPPVFDAQAKGGNPQHEANIVAYTDWLLAKRAEGWQVADIHGPMAKALAEGRAKDPAFKFAGDGVHPGREGHWLMARQVIAQITGDDLANVANAEALFPKNGTDIRKIVRERCSMLHGAWLTRSGHKRPGVPGGPGAKLGLPLDQAQAKSAEMAARIGTLLAQ